MVRTIINITLLLTLIFVADKAYKAYSQKTDYTLFDVKGAPASREKNLRVSESVLAMISAAKPVLYYSTIHEDDLFTMERVEYIPPVEPEPQAVAQEIIEPVIEKPMLILYGVISTGEENYALMEDLKLPKQLAGGRKLKEGDKIHDFTILEILPEKVVIKKEDVQYDVLLYDQSKAKMLTRKKPSHKKSTTEYIQEIKDKQESQKGAIGIIKDAKPVRKRKSVRDFFRVKKRR